ncbi:MAG TPA: cyclase family protein [Tepidiformaceae bacterium]|jgi:arylformamidase|nr:cyclase family protein [Tepidiformaceae bacterium]
MTWTDITVPIRPGMAIFEGDPPLVIAQVSDMQEGGICNLSRMEATLHLGTHIDAPCHFVPGGAGIDETPLECLIGPAWVVEARTIDRHIDAAMLEQFEIPAEAERLLFKTANSELWSQPGFSRDYLAFTEDAAEALASRGVRLVGIDYLSVAPFDDPGPAHTAFLSGGVVVLEGIDLRGVEPGLYELVCLPLLIEGADGAPCRALLRDIDDAG